MVLVTGITGKSGSWFLKRLIDEKDKLADKKYRAIVRDRSKIKYKDCSGISLEYVIGDLDDMSFIEKSMKGVSTVLHIAGVDKSVNIVKAAVNHNVKRMILVHTTGIYSKYKSAGAEYINIEKSIAEVISKKEIEMTILRPTMIYGSVADNNVIIFIKMVNRLRLFPVVDQANYLLQPVFERDLGDAYYQVLMNAEVTKNKNYILSGKAPILLRDMLSVIAKLLGKKVTFISIPFPVAYIGAWFVYLLTFTKIDFREKVQRLVESRNFPHEEASQDFNFNPVSFEKGVKYEVTEFIDFNKRK